MRLDRRLKAARKRLGETQAEFGKRFGADQPTIFRWETGAVKPRRSTAMFIDRVLAELEDKPLPMEAAE